MLALAYLPGPIAGLVQLIRGTAREPFPRAFASWLELRKQLGLFAFWLVLHHLALSCLLLGPGYFGYAVAPPHGPPRLPPPYPPLPP